MSSSTESPKSEKSQKDHQQSTAMANPGFFRRVWANLGLNTLVLILMFKGALAPTIAIAAYQADAFAQQYTTLGYLVAIMALLSLPIQPRAKFIQSMMASVFFTCLGAAGTLLQIQCTVAARLSSTPRGLEIVGQSGSTQSTQYSAAASATSAVWLFVMIFAANMARAYRPQLTLPTIQYSIFAIVGSVYAPLFPNMTAGENFARRLLLAFLTGFGIGSGVGLFVFPITSRKLTAGQMSGLVGLFKGILDAHGQYMVSIAEFHEGERGAGVVGADEAAKVQKFITDAGLLYGKIRIELGFARKEIAWGKWQPRDFSDIFKHLRDILLPAISLGTFLRIVHSAGARTQNQTQETCAASPQMLNMVRRLEQENWRDILGTSRVPYLKLKTALSEGLDHACYMLEITKKPKSKPTDEEQSKTALPGEIGFAATLAVELKNFQEHRETVIRRWCDARGIKMPSTFWEDREAMISLQKVTTAAMRENQIQQQLYLMLYVEFLTFSIGNAILAMARYAEGKVEDGTMARQRLINPGWRRLKKLFSAWFHPSDTDNLFSEEDRDSSQVCMGDSLKQRKDPEHLPAITFYQRVTHYLRVIPETLASPEAAFGFRAALATMSIGIVAYLRQTWDFFLQERGFWALIMIAIGMSPQSGQGVFGFAARIFGTCVAMIASIVIWYIGYKQPGAILPVFFIYLTFGILFIIKNPNYTKVGMVSMVTAILIIGYELQAEKIGVTLATSNGQLFYEIYLLGPHRLAAVCIGLGVAFFWTYFPFPVTTRSTLRKDLGNTFHLLANHCSSVHAVIAAKLGPQAKKNSAEVPYAVLEKASQRINQKYVLMLARLREHQQFTKFEITFGGKFPKSKYDELVDSVSRIFQYLNLIAYSANAFAAEGEDSVWVSNFRRFAAQTGVTSNELTSILCLLSASVVNGSPLPPYLKVPRPYALVDRMASIDPEILSLKHVTEPCYAAFAVLEVASTLLAEEVETVVHNVRDLVGEVDFSFHTVSTDTTKGESTTESDKGKRD